MEMDIKRSRVVNMVWPIASRDEVIGVALIVGRGISRAASQLRRFAPVNLVS